MPQHLLTDPVYQNTIAAPYIPTLRASARYTRPYLPAFVHPGLHPVFEALGYAAAYLLYRAQRTAHGDTLADDTRWSLIAAAAIGALLGSRLLGVLDQLPRGGTFLHLLLQPGGKTVVGGLLGGWLAVEILKAALRIHSRTGDLFALPLCLGIAIGRIGCFIAGVADDTYGKPTTLPWAVNFGDGIPRHPTQLYEMLFLIGLGVLIWRMQQRPYRPGIVFRTFLAAYLSWRLLVDFLKPQAVAAGLSWIQWACILGLVALAISAHPERKPARV